MELELELVTEKRCLGIAGHPLRVRNCVYLFSFKFSFLLIHFALFSKLFFFHLNNV